MAESRPDRRSAPADARGRRIAIVCHCLVNANSKVEGLAGYAGVHPIVTLLAEQGVGVIQMTCPEMSALGMRRWGQTREQYENPAYVEHCRRLAAETLAQIVEYRRCDYEIVGLVGVDGSPSCGVNFSAAGDWGGEHAPNEWSAVVGEVGSARRPGVHLEVLQELLGPLGVRFVAIDEANPTHGVETVMAALLGE